MLRYLKRKRSASTRSAVACSRDAYAIATVRFEDGGRRHLENCVTAAAAPPEQRSRISAWLAEARPRLGALSAVLEPADYELALIEAPDVLPEELKASARWKLRDVLDFPVEEAVVDVFDIPEPARRSGARMMYAVAAKRDAVANQVALFGSAKGHFDVIDIPELALRNLAVLLPESAQGLVLIWVGETHARIIIVKQGTLYLARTVQLEVRSGSAEGVKGAPGAAAVALELQRSVDYFESHYEQPSLAHVVLAPRDVRTARYAEALAAETSLRIRPIDLRQAVDVPQGMVPLGHCGLLAVGAALRTESRAL